MGFKRSLFWSFFLLLGACSTPKVSQIPSIHENEGAKLRKPSSSPKNITRGVGSWYGKRFSKRRTANGERFDMYALTAAHRTLPFGSKVRVKNLKSGRSVVVRINDRGPWSKNRLIDVSYSAGSALGILKTGLAPVEIEVLSP
jgi:rare lipoprotein A